jgi:hypothetical protein
MDISPELDQVKSESIESIELEPEVINESNVTPELTMNYASCMVPEYKKRERDIKRGTLVKDRRKKHKRYKLRKNPFVKT